MASLRKRGKIWYVRVRDESGRQREVKAGPDKSIANQMKRDLESKTQRIKAGVLDPREADAMEAERIPITKHVADYIQVGSKKFFDKRSPRAEARTIEEG